MTTETSKRAEANRRNARKSTGPRTAEGKERSRFNALKHGLSAKVDVLPGEDTEAFRSRLEAWTADIQPRDEVERYLVERAVHVSWQLDRADRAQAARLSDARFAGADRTGGVADEVAALGRRLFWDPRGPGGLSPGAERALGAPRHPFWSGEIDDPDDPARVLNRLEGSALGCAWLLDRWGDLRAILEDGLKWQPIDRFRAVRLLGHQPIDATDDRQVRSIYLACWAMDPVGPHAFLDVTADLSPDEGERFLERLEGRGALSAPPEDPEDARAGLLDRIAGEEARLEEVLAVHLAREEAAGERMTYDETDSGEGLRRYQLTFNRTLLRILETLRKRRQESGEPRQPVRMPRRNPEPPRLSGYREFAAALVVDEPPDDGNPEPPCPTEDGEVSQFGWADAPLRAPREDAEARTELRPAVEVDGSHPASASTGSARKDRPRPAGNSKNEANDHDGPGGRSGEPASGSRPKSKNEANEPAVTAKALAALLGLLRMVLAWKSLPRSAISALATPIPHLIGASRPPRLAMIPIPSRPRSSPS